MYIDAVVAVFAPALRIWTSHGGVLSDYVSGQSYAIAIEIIQGFLTTINVVDLKGAVLHTEQLEFPFESLKWYADTLQGIPIFSLRHELQPEYRAKVVIEQAKIILSLDWAETPSKPLH
ncbi:hypothetical protein D3C87_965570 [compost metagenome]